MSSLATLTAPASNSVRIPLTRWEVLWLTTYGHYSPDRLRNVHAHMSTQPAIVAKLNKLADRLEQRGCRNLLAVPLAKIPVILDEL